MDQKITAAAAILLDERALAYPTETYYGLGCMALSGAALEQLATWKPRDPGAKPYPMIVGDRSQVGLVVPSSAVTPLAEALMAQCWPGPLTLVLPGLSGLDPRICSSSGGVAVRVSSHPMAGALALAVGQPIVSTSANPSGQPPPQTPAEVRAAFAPRQLDVLDGGVCRGGAPVSLAAVAAMGALAPWRELLLRAEEAGP